MDVTIARFSNSLGSVSARLYCIIVSKSLAKNSVRPSVCWSVDPFIGRSLGASDGHLRRRAAYSTNGLVYDVPPYLTTMII